MAATTRRLILLALAAALVAGCDRAGDKPAFKGIDITGADYAGSFSLTDVDGRRRTLDEFKGKAVVVFFGYTQCPDVCPTTMAEIAQAKQALGPDGDRVQPVFITVDPARDTPVVLKAYMASFGPDFVALRGSEDEIKQTARQFKVFYAKAQGKTPDSYTMDHTAGSYLFDPQGRVRLFTRYGTGAEALASDLRRLLSDAH